MYVYDVARDNWDTLQTTAAPFPFTFSSALLMSSGKLMFFGGVVADPTQAPPLQVSARVWSYDGALKQWDAWESAPWPTQAAVAVWLPGGPPGSAAAGLTDPLAALNATLPAVLLVGGGNAGGSLAGVAQLRGLPAAAA